MSKKVLVIDTENNVELADFVYQIREMNLAKAKVFIENSSFPGNLLTEFEARVEKPEKGRALYQITLPPLAITALYATKLKWDGFGSTEKKYHVLILDREEK